MRRAIVPPKLAFVAGTSYMLTRFPTSEFFVAPPGLVRGGDDPYPEGDDIFLQAMSRRVMADDTKKKTSPGQFFNQVKAETNKVVWPSREETVRTAIFVFIMMAILSLFFLGVDSLFGAVVRWLLTLI